MAPASRLPPTRLNNPATSAIVVIMQRLHAEDVAGTALKLNLGYEHLMLPMEFEPDRRCHTCIGFKDPGTRAAAAQAKAAASAPLRADVTRIEGGWNEAAPKADEPDQRRHSRRWVD